MMSDLQSVSHPVPKVNLNCLSIDFKVILNEGGALRWDGSLRWAEVGALGWGVGRNLSAPPLSVPS